MINPLARVVMKNITKTTRGKKDSSRGKNTNFKTHSLSDLAGKTTGLAKEKKTNKVSREENPERIETISFNDISREIKGEEVEKTSREYKPYNKKIENTYSLTDLTRNIKGNQGRLDKDIELNKKNKNCSFSDLVGNREKEKKTIEKKYKDNEIVGDYIDRKDRYIVSNLISGQAEPKEKTRSTSILNLSQAVSSLINK